MKQIRQHIIPALRTEDDVSAVLKCDAKMVFLLSGSICTLGETCRALHAAGKIVMLHIDLIDGLKGDESGIRYAVGEFGLAGIISTKVSCLNIAKDLGIISILRVFVIDSSAIRTGIAHVQACAPNFVEVLPGVSEKIIKLASLQFKTSVIAGGLIADCSDVEYALRAGAAAVSTSNRSLWGLSGI